ncbi:transmembrane protein, putative (macronuclear) [Tetrahymena thermophila SB210]|uniref:Transmembrane protein, putative n=1 Tax=Tetrahymena thermophila (strain SB210) TaxID=312017 RepID=Q22KR3_TETTS|nr:transmembrane protein, putative [Tetrahymena thermophila SB210]EAR85736.2 transmembrane protein, putative [Tetrahymena thermophila SB210]|eukprot:XP_001033399.2 transmembrane protein, putative [Tetrahymena thermophila SB210]
MIFYYFMFWRPQSNRIYTYNFINTLLFIASIWIYFDTFYGIYHKTLDIKLQEVSQCKVIGKETVDLGGVEFYSILYVDFVYNNQQLLGYSCQSSLSKEQANSKISPNEFYFKRDKIACDYYSQDSIGVLQSESQANGYQQQHLKSNKDIIYQNSQPIPGCYNQYTFSDVKLPSWLCIPSDFPFQTMIDSEKCYLNFYGDISKAQQNALSRAALKDVQDFALITYNQIPIPKWTYQPLLIFDFNILIISLNSIYFYIVFFFKQALLHVLGKKIQFQELKEEDCLFYNLQKQKEQRVLLNQENKFNALSELNNTNEVVQQSKNKLNCMMKQKSLSQNKDIHQDLDKKMKENLNLDQNNFEKEQKNSQFQQDIVKSQKQQENLITDNQINQYLATEVDYVQEDTSLNSSKHEREQDESLQPQLIELQTSSVSSKKTCESKKINYFNSPTDTLISFTPRRKKLTAAQSTFN